MSKYIKKYNKYNESKKEKINMKQFSFNDFTIFQGRDSIANDYVTLELATENDIWFHAKGVPGSHVVIKVKDNLPTQDVIKYAASLAAKNCKSKEDRIPVIYCKKMFVKKEKGMNPGQVSVDYKNANEIIVSKNNI